MGAASVLESFMTWLLARHGNRTLLTWNGDGFDYPQIEGFLRRHHPGYLDAWADLRTADLYRWAVREGNALLPGRTNKLDHVARALGYDAAATVEKRRDRYAVADCRVTLDRVSGIGEFVEVEYHEPVVEGDIDGARGAVTDLVTALGLDPAASIQTSYLGLQLAAE
jgi:hypothetical protein